MGNLEVHHSFIAVDVHTAVPLMAFSVSAQGQLQLPTPLADTPQFSVMNYGAST